MKRHDPSSKYCECAECTFSKPQPVLQPVEYSTHGCDFTFYCPGCQEHHAVWTKKRNDLGAIWSFNGSLEKPTFYPSLLIRGKRPINGEEYQRIMAGEKLNIPDRVCHSYIRDGLIQFLADCTHPLAGKTVPLPAVE